MKAVLSICAVALSSVGTEAFAPTNVLSRSRTADSSLSAKSEAMPFMERPERLPTGWAGDKGFDPLGFSSVSTKTNMNYLREAEIKHGRVCMMATLGFVAVDCGFVAPQFEKVSSLKAHDANLGWMALIFLLVGTIEIFTAKLIGDPDREPGNFGFDPAGLEKYDKKGTFRENEITHGRAAMLAFSGIVTQSALFNTGFPYFGNFGS
uniref:Plastid light harvesting protein n=1 Tax=Chromera velia CCMP2878 TaxID=1169474 RepID=A0A0G4FT14_9ALVE|mmetsp:Transcript_12814/g.25033  ORF Transcript_12814/g.25033 Transcript_12814/m.25033 type:complete len:207 (+) Transcript_12814:177-797(+)|eukprot:Cvel_18504.t1-p1 / transcript=Cvel_18504.t1 / gene=Cvel_18504 / organism=Chromera_velia_CCMP2878 / gene_product=Fucoxanthin-chlorophyll a-c binding protein,, putative / transcript_product=Fucoxanthin-chlorophyll a-c binding protein,, putative / location=Cvel_scaffold1536:30342-33668(+) / protein_length=206 / sequence_SO=supercontig / SO=protein_coding / is_pseudo=false